MNQYCDHCNASPADNERPSNISGYSILTQSGHHTYWGGDDLSMYEQLVGTNKCTVRVPMSEPKLTLVVTALSHGHKKLASVWHPVLVSDCTPTRTEPYKERRFCFGPTRQQWQTTSCNTSTVIKRGCSIRAYTPEYHEQHQSCFNLPLQGLRVHSLRVLVDSKFIGTTAKRF